MLTKAEIQKVRHAVTMLVVDRENEGLGHKTFIHSCCALAHADNPEKNYISSSLVKKYTRFYGMEDAGTYWPDLGRWNEASDEKKLQRELMLDLFAETKGEL